MRTKILAGVLTAAMCLRLLAGCGHSGSTTPPPTTGNDKATEAGGAATQAPETTTGGNTNSGDKIVVRVTRWGADRSEGRTGAGGGI